MASLTTDAPSAVTVLHCSPAEEDARLPFVGLVDLFAPVPESCLEPLAPEPRAALRAALLHGPEPADGRGRLAVRLAVLEVLRALAATGPVVLVVDGLQWLDAPTAEVLAFAVRRLGGLDIRVVAAERVADGEQPDRLRCCPPGTTELPVPALTDDDVAHLVRTGVGTDLPSGVLRSVQDTAAGSAKQPSPPSTTTPSASPKPPSTQYNSTTSPNNKAAPHPPPAAALFKAAPDTHARGNSDRTQHRTTTHATPPPTRSNTPDQAKHRPSL
ncbi:AAA family ATPase [Streptomyces collinus]